MAGSLKKIILLIETSREFGRELLNGIARYSKLHGPWSFYLEPRALKSSIPRLRNWNADGIVMRNSVISADLISLKLPTVLCLHESRRLKHLPVVTTDSKVIAKLASEHLLNRGMKNFAFCGFDNFEWSNERKEHFNNFILEAGFNVSMYEQGSKSISWDREQQLLTKWLVKLPKPAGIFACNDDRGQQVLEACKAARISVPEEISVIGVDNDPIICGFCDPPLTSIALNTEYAGYALAELLDKLMNGEPMNGQEIKVTATHVVRRQSTDIIFVEDEAVAEAIKYIRQNAKNKIRVDDVVEHTYLSRRSLESRFKKIVHRSIQEEIRRVRTDLIAQMLVETNLTISEITAIFNFTDVEHISRYFKKEKGLGLREFRKLCRKA
jgi:LacI family transcriptional regulator